MENGGWALRGEFLRRTFQSGDAETVAVDGVSLDLLAGQVALLMGPSGCGKSTLLSLLSGLLRPDAGRVIVLGENLWTMSDARRRLFRLRHFGFVFQGHNLFPTLTAREQLELTLDWGDGAGGSSARRRTEEVLEMLGIASRGDLLPLHLSGGEKQRVAIGRALIKQPSFCFADEPTSALDWKHGQGVIELLQRAARQHNTAVLLVSHDPRIGPYVDRTFEMEDGRLRESRNAE
jgi:putative ABC transport system ATP-binding protein